MVKAGRVGSSPNGATKEPPPSEPLSLLLKEIGGAVFSLNTLVVGLDAVENGHEKPASLDISWNPDDPQIAARKSRKFVLEAVLVRVSEALNQHVLALTKLPRLATVQSKFDINTPVAEKISKIATTLLGRENYLIPAVALLVHWRNRIVHVKSHAKLTQNEMQLLRAHEEEIAEKYKGLSVNRLLCHFEEKRPTLKDISSLIAMSINLAREIDKALVQDLGKDDLDAWLNHYGVCYALKKVKAETSPKKIDEAIRRTIRSLAPMLLAPYLEHYGPSTENSTDSNGRVIGE